MSHADWTPSPLVEGEAKLLRKQVKRHDRIALTLGAAGIVGVTGAGIALAILYLPGAVAAVLGIALVLGAFWAAYRFDGVRASLIAASEEADEILQREFGTGEGWFVDLFVHEGEAPTGVDRGMLWIEDGRLVFAGHRTSFSLSTGQALGVRRQIPVRDVRYEIRVDLSSGQAVSFGCRQGRSYGTAKGATQGLLLVVRMWARRPAVGGGQLPPSSLGPGAPSHVRLLGRAVGSTAFYTVMLWLVALALPSGLYLYLAFAFYTAGSGWNLWHPFALWRAWWARRRLRG